MKRALTIAIAPIVIASACRPREDHAGEHSYDPVALMTPKAPDPIVDESTHLYGSAPTGFVDLVREARRGVVSIRSSLPVKSGPAAMFPGAPETTADTALGSGFLIESGGVFVVTTDKIASAAAGQNLLVVLDDTTSVPAKVIGREVELDVALLQIDRARLEPIPMGSSSDLKIGEWLVVLGNPFGEEVTAAAGIVSSTGREAAGSLMQDRGMGYRTFRMFIQTDARIHRGNSGGPVLDTAGQVVGMAIATGDHPGELSFVLPIDRIREIVPDLRDRGQVSRSWLGIKVKPVTSDVGATIGLAAGTGAYVSEIVPGSPATASSNGNPLRVGDVILEWNGKPVDQRSLPWLVSASAPGTEVTVTLWRNRAKMATRVRPARMPK